MSKGRKSGPSGGGSRTVTYILLALIVVFVGYYLVLPAFTPHSTTTLNGGTGTSSSSTATLNPTTDVSGASVTVSGTGFSAGSNVTIKFDGSGVLVSNHTTGATYCAADSRGVFAQCTFWVPKAASGPHNVTVATGGTSVLKTFKIPAYTPPVSTVLVTMTSIALGTITQLATRRLVDLNAERRMRAEVNAFNKEKREATLAKDKAKLDKIKKRELQMQQEQFKVQRARLKVTAVTFVPLLGVYYLMATFLGGYGVIVAYTPIPIPYFAGATQVGSVFQVSLFWWYFLSSFTFSAMLSRLFHTTT